MIGEVEKRRAGRKLLPHEEQRRLRREEQQSRQSTPRGGLDDVMQTVAECPIAYLIVILQADDKTLRRDALGVGAPRLAAPARRLSGIEPALS